MRFRKDEQQVKHDIQRAHQHMQQARHAHVAAGLKHAAAEVVRLHERQTQRIDEKVARSVDANLLRAAQPARQQAAHRRSRCGEQHAKAHGRQKPLLHEVARRLDLPRANPLGHLHGKAHCCRGAEAIEEPCTRRHQTD